jgi:hypothetical protein
MEKRFISINYEFKYSSICDTIEEVFISCGYEEEYEKGTITFEELLERIKGEYEIIEIVGEIKWLND